MNTDTKQYIYLDHAATTPVDPRVLEAMLPFLREQYGNPSSIHGPGRVVKAAIEQAREEVARLINALPAEIVFTSGGTESDNEAVRLAMQIAGDGRTDILTSPAEHHAVLSACKHAEQTGAVVRYLPVDGAAVPDIDQIDALIGPQTAFCSLMHVNNETGGVLPLAETARTLARHDVLFHCDAVQSAGKLPLDVRDIPVSLLSLSAHKIHGPKGVGALYVRNGLRIGQLQFGGGQERGRRGGTENVASIIGFGAAARIAREEMDERHGRWHLLRAIAVGLLNDALPELHYNGGGDASLPNILSITLPSSRYDIDGGALLMNCDVAGLAISSGSACAAGSIEPSHVIRAIGRDDAETAATVRISFGAFTNEEEVRNGIGIFIRVVQEMSARSSPRSHSRMTMP
ncbi:MAG: cysteine desulfurase [Bacteroidetes bacterium]|nr:cysteine desulfurase [Bacteroidota bacterium]